MTPIKAAAGEVSREDDGKSVQMLLAQLIVNDAEHSSNVRIVDQRIPASVYDKALAAANRLAAHPAGNDGVREALKPFALVADNYEASLTLANQALLDEAKCNGTVAQLKAPIDDARQVSVSMGYCRKARAALALPQARSQESAPGAGTFQHRVHGWMMECFTMEIGRDRQERNHRFLEEALELVQANGCTASEAHQLVDYVYGRDQGEINQEVGGVMVTLAALCIANDISMHEGGETELARIMQPGVMDKIRAKQAAKPKHSPLPGEGTQAREAGTENRAQLAYEIFLAGINPPSTLPKWSDAAPWFRDAMLVSYLQGKLDASTPPRADAPGGREIADKVLADPAVIHLRACGFQSAAKFEAQLRDAILRALKPQDGGETP